jgi:uncharacterized protein YkwD
VHHRPTPPPSLRARFRGHSPSGALRHTRRQRPLWAPLLLAVAVAAVALTAALAGGTLPGLSDASAATDAEQDPGTPGASTASTPASTAPAVAPVAVAPTTAIPVPVPSTTEAPPPAPSPTATASVATPKPAAAPAPAADTPAPAPAPPVAAAAAPGPEGEVLALVNVQRAAAGCPALRADAGLAAVARAHSADMRDRNYFSHVDPDGNDPFARARAAGIDYARAENIAYGQADPAAVMTAWMNSSGHRANILNCSLGTLGVGIAQGANGPLWTQLFGS